VINIWTSFSTDNDNVREALAHIDRLGDGDPAKHEALARLHMTLVRTHWIAVANCRHAEAIDAAAQRSAEGRRQARATRAAKPEGASSP
jgi:hypothetical protein